MLLANDMDIEDYIELTALKPDTVMEDVETVCDEAIENKISFVCVPPLFVRKAKELAAETAVSICTVTGFPFGYSAIEAKVAEIVLAIIDGADEIAMVVNTSAVKNNDWQFLANEINTVMQVTRAKGKKMTVIIETGFLSDAEIITACDIYGAAAVDTIQLGTGFFENGAMLDQVKLVRKHAAAIVQIKAGVPVQHYNVASQLIKAGASRVCCTNSLNLIQESLQQN